MLYEQDFQAWINQHIELLKTRQFTELDIDNLIEELDGMARRDRTELVSRLIILLAHLLKWQFQPARQSRSWEDSIAEQRVQVLEQLECSPSLQVYLSEAIAKAYPKAIKLAARETRLEAAVFPVDCPYSQADALNENFYPHI